MTEDRTTHDGDGEDITVTHTHTHMHMHTYTQWYVDGGKDDGGHNDDDTYVRIGLVMSRLVVTLLLLCVSRRRHHRQHAYMCIGIVAMYVSVSSLSSHHRRTNRSMCSRYSLVWYGGVGGWDAMNTHMASCLRAFLSNASEFVFHVPLCVLSSHHRRRFTVWWCVCMCRCRPTVWCCMCCCRHHGCCLLY